MNDTMVPELAGLMNMISDMMNETALIPDVARIVLGYARPCHDNTKFLMTYFDRANVRFIIDNKFGVSLHISLEYHHNRNDECEYDRSDGEVGCTCSHEYMSIIWNTAICNDYWYSLVNTVKFSDIWRYATTGSDTRRISDGELTPDKIDYKKIADAYGKHCMAPGFREIIRRLMHKIWFGNEKSEERIVYLDQ